MKNECSSCSGGAERAIPNDYINFEFYNKQFYMSYEAYSGDSSFYDKECNFKYCPMCGRELEVTE